MNMKDSTQAWRSTGSVFGPEHNQIARRGQRRRPKCQLQPSASSSRTSEIDTDKYRKESESHHSPARSMEPAMIVSVVRKQWM